MKTRSKNALKIIELWKLISVSRKTNITNFHLVLSAAFTAPMVPRRICTVGVYLSITSSAPLLGIIDLRFYHSSTRIFFSMRTCWCCCWWESKYIQTLFWAHICWVFRICILVLERSKDDFRTGFTIFYTETDISLLDWYQSSLAKIRY